MLTITNPQDRTTSVVGQCATPRDAAFVVAVPGPKGDQAPVGPSGSGTYSRIAAQALGGHRVVRSVSANQVDYADSSDETHADDVFGVTIAAASSGASVNVVRLGEVTEPSWTWTPLEPIFAGLNGQLTQVVPTYPAHEFSLIIGHATSATTAFIDIGQPILLR